MAANPRTYVFVPSGGHADEGAIQQLATCMASGDAFDPYKD